MMTKLQDIKVLTESEPENLQKHLDELCKDGYTLYSVVPLSHKFCITLVKDYPEQTEQTEVLDQMGNWVEVRAKPLAMQITKETKPEDLYEFVYYDYIRWLIGNRYSLNSGHGEVGWVTAEEGDWIVVDVNGYPHRITDEIFQARWEIVE